MILLPDQPGPHPHLLVSAGKNGTIYVVDRDNMGGFNATRSERPDPDEYLPVRNPVARELQFAGVLNGRSISRLWRTSSKCSS